MKYKKYKGKPRKDNSNITIMIFKAALLFAIFAALMYSVEYTLSPGVKIYIEKGKLLEKQGKTIFSKSFPPNLDAVDAYRIIVESVGNKEREIVVKIPYEGDVEKVYWNDFELKENEIVLYLSLSPEQRETIYITGELSLSSPKAYEKEYYSQRSSTNKTNSTKNSSSLPPSKIDKENEAKSNEEEPFDLKPILDEINMNYKLDTYSVIVLSLALILLVISSLIIASFNPKESRKKKPLEPGEILFVEDI